MANIAEIARVKLADIRPYERNAKIHGPEQIDKLKKSITEFGFVNPCLIDRDYNLIAGHGRVMAATELGMESVPCVFVEGLTDEQRRAYILADNKLAELAEWNEATLAQELTDLSNEGIEISILGFDWDSTAKIEPIEDEYELTETEKTPTAKKGQVWKLGEHRLMCGDSTDPESMDKLFGGELADMVFTDPPYGVSIGSRNKAINAVDKGKGGQIEVDIENDTLSADELYEMLVAAFSELRAHSQEYCSYYVTSPMGGELGLVMLNMMKNSGLPVRHILIWVKSSPAFSMGRLDYDYRHEPILYTWGKSHKFRGGYDNSVIDEYGNLEKLEKSELKELVHALRGDGKTSTIYCDKPTHSDLHPTMKPIRLISRFIYNNSEEGDIVADIFGGSGSTMIACEQLKRRCYMMELDPHYCDVIIDRWEKFTGEKAVLING